MPARPTAARARLPAGKGRARGCGADRRPGALPGDHGQLPRSHLPGLHGTGVVREGAGGIPRRLVAAGCRPRLDVVAGVRGGRRGQCLRSRPAGPDPGGRGDGSAGVPGTASPDQRGGRRALRLRHRRSAGAAPAEILSGEAVATWCLAEVGCSGLPQAITLEARPEGQGFVLSGRKGAAQAAAESDFFVVAALVGGEPTQFLVDADAPGGGRPGRGPRPHAPVRLRRVRPCGRGARCRPGFGGRRGGPDRATLRVGGDAAVRLHGRGRSTAFSD